MIAAIGSSQRSAARGRVVPLALCFLGALIEGFDIQAAGITAQKFAAFYGLGKTHLGLAFSANTLGLFVGAMLGGWFADRIGRKPVLVACFVTFGVFSIATALAPSVGTFLLMRVLTGLGLGGSVANLVAVAAELGADASRTMRVTVLSSGIPFGGMSVSLLAAQLPVDYDWRLIFIIGGVLPLILAALFHLKLPDVAAERHGQKASLPALFKGGSATVTLCLWIACFATMLTLHLLLNWLPSLLVWIGHTARESAVVAVVFSLSGAIGGIALGLIIHRAGRKLIFTSSCLGIVVGLALLITLGDLMWGAILGAGVIGFFLMGNQLLIYGLAPAFYRTEVLSTGVGFTIAAGRLGSMVGPFAAGVVLSAGAGSNVVIGAMVPLAMVALIAILVLLTLRKPVSHH
jgi:AAHS family 3-hydroxyphenylpropionic acid transporter